MPNETRAIIKNIIAGIIIKGGGKDNCTTIRNLICPGFETSTAVKKDFEGKAIIKEKQANLIKSYCHKNNLWLANLPRKDRYLTRVGGSTCPFRKRSQVCNQGEDAVYYATWPGFFNSILLGNLIFQDTAYTL